MIPQRRALSEAAMATKKVDPVAWAKAHTRPLGGHKCATCWSVEIRPVVAKWAAMWKAGETTMSVRQAWGFLRENFGYRLTESALAYCLRNHHGYKPNG